MAIISDAQTLAASKGGKCLSTNLKNKNDLLEWECDMGHNWLASYKSVKGTVNGLGTWCPSCKGRNKIKYSLKTVKDQAEKQGGKCLSTAYKNSVEKMIFCCDQGHIFSLSPVKLIRQGSWCRQCHENRQGRTIKLSELKKKVESNGGKVLTSDEVRNNSEVVYLECAKGHPFKSEVAKIIKKWRCPKCEEQARQDLIYKTIKKKAKEREGKVLTRKEGIKTQESKVMLKCKKGHTWTTTAGIIIKGSWCWECRKNTIELMREIAARRDGECLSTQYIDAHQKLLWRCKNQHLFEATANSVKDARTWCPKCRERKGVGKITKEPNF